MTYVHDPRHRTVRPSPEPLSREFPRPRDAAPSARSNRDEPELRSPLGAFAGAAGVQSSVCSDCNLGFGRHVHLHLRPVPEEVGRVRTAVRTALTSWGCPSQAVDDSLLLASELVGNAVKHAPDAWITLDLLQVGDHLLMEVTDGCLVQPVVHQAGPDDEQGRGMYLVQAIASAWGARRDCHNRKTTWCTLALDGNGGALQ